MNIKNSLPLLKHLEKIWNLIIIANLNSQHSLMEKCKTDDNEKILFHFLLQSSLININV